MNKRMLSWAIAAWVASASPVGAAARNGDPADPKAASVPLRFESGLGPRKPAPAVDPPARWREHNDRVRAIGGHAGHLRAAAREFAPAGDPAAGEAKP